MHFLTRQHMYIQVYSSVHKFRISRLEVFCKNTDLKILENSRENTRGGVLFLPRLFSSEFRKTFRAAFLQKTS